MRKEDAHNTDLEITAHFHAHQGGGTLPKPQRIRDLGIRAALLALLPSIREAGLLARRLQPFMSPSDARLSKEGSAFASALTDADLMVEDRIGQDVWLRLSDASFYGEERPTEKKERQGEPSDRISRYIPDGRPYIVTLDPINGTLYYKSGMTTYEVIVTICDEDWRMLGALVYRPMYDDVFLGWKDPRDGSDAAYHVTFYERGLPTPMPPKVERLTLKDRGERVVLLGRDYGDQADTVRQAGYTPIYPWRDFTGQPGWNHATESLLTGGSVGRLGAGAQLIDSAAFGFLVERAGGIHEPGPFDREQKTYAHGLIAVDEATASLLRTLLLRKLTTSS